MFLPYDTSISLWLRAVPTYEFEPEAPPPPSEAAANAAAGDSGAGEAAQSVALPPLRLVFKGMRWITVPVWSVRENVAWEQVVQNRRDEDEEQTKENGRQVRRQPHTDHVSAPAGAPDGTQGPDDLSAAEQEEAAARSKS